MLCIFLSLCPFLLHASVDSGPQLEREEQVLREMWKYKPELPRHILSSAVGMQGDRSRLERVIAAMIRGDPVKIVLMGGSLSMRGWNYPDESFIRQLHKWLELAFIPGCREEARRRADEEAASPSPPMWKGKYKEEPQQDDGKESEETYKEVANSELAATLPSEDGEWIPERGPRPPTDLHHIPSAGYRRDGGHLCPSAGEVKGSQGKRFKIELINLAVPATGPGYAERCMLSRLPEDADLVILDFGINDFQQGSKLNHPERQAFERIMRRALTLPRSSAVVLYSAYSDYQAHGSFVGKSKEGENLSQNKHILIAEYYGQVQCISVRAAFWQIINAASDDPNKLIYLGRHFLNDLIHVTPYGHRWNADLMISFLRDLATEMIAKRRLARSLPFLSDLESQPGIWSWPSPMDPDEPEGCWAGDIVNETHCQIKGSWGKDYFVSHSSPAASSTIRSSPISIKPPFFLGNEYEPSGVCAIGSEFKDLASSNEGWEWLNEGKPGKPKWGFVSEKVGMPLVIDIDIEGQVKMIESVAEQERMKVKEAQDSKESDWGGGGSGNVRLRTQDVTAFLIYLSSWRDMGTAEVSCDGSWCSCKPSTINAHAKDMRFRASVPVLHKFSIQAKEEDKKSRSSRQEGKCQIKIEIVDETSSQGHRFKVQGLTTSTNDLFHLDYIVRENLDVGR